MHSSSVRNIRRSFGIIACLLGFLTAGCHNNNIDSGYGVAWLTMTGEPEKFASYNVYLDGIVLTRDDGALVTAYPASYYEKVDVTKITDLAEMIGTYTGVATGTYTSAQLILDYTSATVYTLVNGVPTLATVVDDTGMAVTTQAINITFDPANPFVLQPTYASTAAARLHIDVNLAASTRSINTATTPVTVTVKPFVTMSVSAADQRLIRVRGPLINSSVGENTFTVYVRPFYDQADAIGLLTVFNDPTNTIFGYNGKLYQGAAGINAVSQSSSGTTIVAAYTTYTPTSTPSAAAGIFNGVYVVGGSTLQDNYTYGLEGTVIARNGNVLTVRGATLSVNDGSISTSSSYLAAPTFSTEAQLTVGPQTTVTQDDSLAVLDYNAIGVGQHIAARGDYALNSTVVSIDATGNSGATTGSVRILPEQVTGQYVSSTDSSLVLGLQYINFWPASVFNFTGNGATAAQDTNPAAFDIATTAAATGFTVGDPVLATGTIPGFGVTPPDFTAASVSVDTAVPASIRVTWLAAGTAVPLSGLSDAGFTIDPANAAYVSGVIRVGAEEIDLGGIAPTLQIVPLPLQSTTTSLTSPTTPAPVYNPLFAVGNPTLGIFCFSIFDSFITKLNAVVATTPATQLEARGVWNRTTNVFTATTVNVVI